MVDICRQFICFYDASKSSTCLNFSKTVTLWGTRCKVSKISADKFNKIKSKNQYY